jgi:hypothetical protein
MRIVAILAAYNEERYIGAQLEHLFRHGIQAYLIDNESTDGTVNIARRYLGRNLMGLETLPRRPHYSHRAKLERKEELALTLEADWFIHLDADEFRLPPRSDWTLAQAFEQVDALGYNSVDFREFVFIPTLEAPDHDHPDFIQTMRWYYPFLPTLARPHRQTAWKRQSQKVDLVSSGGHSVQFSGLRIAPQPFRLRHYHFLSVRHAIEKLVGRPYDPNEISRGWHTWRATIKAEDIRLPSARELRGYISDDVLDAADPWTEEWLEIMARREDPISTRRRIRMLERQIQELNERVITLVAQVGERQQAVESLITRLAAQTHTADALAAQLSAQSKEKEQTLRLIYNSKLWKLGTAYRSIAGRVWKMAKR